MGRFHGMVRNIWNALTLSCLEKVARWAVLAAEVGGRWSDETAQFMHLLAKSRSECSCTDEKPLESGMAPTMVIDLGVCRCACVYSVLCFNSEALQAQEGTSFQAGRSEGQSFILSRTIRTRVTWGRIFFFWKKKGELCSARRRT